MKRYGLVAMISIVFLIGCNNFQKNVDYFVGDLVEGKYLPDNLKGMQVKNGVGEILLPPETKKVTITAVMYTGYQNYCIVSKTISFNSK